MGCDIHIFKEKLVNNKWITNNTWRNISPDDEEYQWRKVECTDSDHVTRNYALFGWLADVRSAINQGYQAHGLPADVSPEVKQESDSWSSDGHSHSWMDLETLTTHPAALRITIGADAEYVLPGIDNILSHFSEDDIKEPEKHRIVFWFDN